MLTVLPDTVGFASLGGDFDTHVTEFVEKRFRFLEASAYGEFPALE